MDIVLPHAIFHKIALLASLHDFLFDEEGNIPEENKI